MLIWMVFILQESSTCESISGMTNESHSNTNNTSRSNTPLSHQGSRGGKSKSSGKSKAKKKKALWTVTNKHGKPLTKSKYSYS